MVRSLCSRHAAEEFAPGQPLSSLWDLIHPPTQAHDQAFQVLAFRVAAPTAEMLEAVYSGMLEYHRPSVRSFAIEASKLR